MHFEKYIDYDFTANLEDQLDAVSRGEKQWIPVLDEFWKPFKKTVDIKETDTARDDFTRQLGTDEGSVAMVPLFKSAPETMRTNQNGVACAQARK